MNFYRKFDKKKAKTACRISEIGNSVPNSCCIEVTPLSVNPHGLIFLKWFKSVFTFKAKPCIVTKWLQRIPIAHIFRLFAGFSPSIQTPVAPAKRVAVMPYSAKTSIMDFSTLYI